MVITTTPVIEGRKIKRYCGIANGEAVIGADVFQGSFGSISDIAAGRTEPFGKVLKAARETAFKEIQESCLAAGGSAVLNIQVAYTMVGGGLMVSATGTAVLMEGELH
jgi:uncharacterized protein YbjQ (UPF0145 family)